MRPLRLKPRCRNPDLKPVRMCLLHADPATTAPTDMRWHAGFPDACVYACWKCFPQRAMHAVSKKRLPVLPVRICFHAVHLLKIFHHVMLLSTAYTAQAFTEFLMR